MNSNDLSPNSLRNQRAGFRRLACPDSRNLSNFMMEDKQRKRESAAYPAIRAICGSLKEGGTLPINGRRPQASDSGGQKMNAGPTRLLTLAA